MEHLDYFKLQAKNLFKDYKTRFFNEESKLYEYKSKYFDIGRIFIDFDFPDYKDDFTFTLMNAQHLIAKIIRLDNWSELLALKEEELRLAHRRLDLSKYREITVRLSDAPPRETHLPAPQNLYAFMLPQLGGFKITFTFDAVEYAQNYLIYSSFSNDIATAKPLAAGQFSPITYVAHHQSYAPYYWVRAFDGKEYGEWSAIARKNR